MARIKQGIDAGADEVVPWEGKSESVGWAIQRALAARGQGATRTTPRLGCSVVNG